MTNELNDTIQANEAGVKKPYLYLIHEPGKSSSYFLEYFKDSLLRNTFHIVAPDRFGFGKTHLLPVEGEMSNLIIKPETEEFGELTAYLSKELENNILSEEGKFIDEVRSISNGDAAMIGLTNWNANPLYTKRYFLFNPTLQERNSMANFYSKMVSITPFSYVFPRTFINKHKDLQMIEKTKQEFLKMYINWIFSKF